MSDDHATKESASSEITEKISCSVVVTPDKSTRREWGRSIIRYQRGWCLERCERQNCSCYKAKYPQHCQACHEMIDVSHCIEKPGCGWVHVRCRGDEKRSDQSAIYDSFLPQTNFLTHEGTERKLTYDDSEEENDKVESEEKQSEDDEEESKEAEEGNVSLIVKAREQNSSSESSSIYDNRKVPYEDRKDTSSQRFSLSDEQKVILDYEISPGEIVKIKALAGCGKTSTCALICNKMNSRLGNRNRQLYVVFNKDAMIDALESHKFPKNVRIITSHAFAKRTLFGTESTFKPTHTYDRDEVSSLLHLNSFLKTFFPIMEKKKLRKIRYSVVRNIIRTVEKFQQSNMNQICEENVPWRKRSKSLDDSHWEANVSTTNYVSWARELFDFVHRRCHYHTGESSNDPGSQIGITHDAYLKYLQLHSSEYDDAFQYDAVIVDEAQDMTDCQASLLWGETMKNNARIFLVGDEHQRIYRFRGATECFERARASTSFSLSGSFRFGNNIGSVANAVLKGAGSTETLKGMSLDPGKIIPRNHIEQGVVICRTRNGILRYLEDHRPHRWTFVSKHMQLPDTNTVLVPLEKFILKQSPTFKYKSERFNDWEELQTFCEEEGDSKMLNDMNLVKDYLERNEGASIKILFDEIRRSCIQNWREEQTSQDVLDINKFNGVALVTCHGTKGLEFDNVLIHNDFSFDQLMEKKSGEFLSHYFREMQNLVYVALTRAKKKLYLCEKASDYVKWITGGGIDYSVIDEIEQSPTDMKLLRTNFEAKWNQFINAKGDVHNIDDVPWPEGSDGNEFALDSSMCLSEQKAFIKPYLLRYNKFNPMFGDSIKLDHVDQSRLQAKLNEVCRVVHKLWSTFRQAECTNCYEVVC